MCQGFLLYFRYILRCGWRPLPIRLGSKGVKLRISYLEDHPRTCKWLGWAPIYKPLIFRPFRRGPTTPGMGDKNDHHGYEPLHRWDDSPSTANIMVLGFDDGILGDVSNPRYTSTVLSLPQKPSQLSTKAPKLWQTKRYRFITTY